VEAMSVFHLCPARRFCQLQPAAGCPELGTKRLSDIGIARWRGTVLALLWHRRKLSEETIDGQADQSLRRTVGAGSGDLL
jgi:hypothetical protein